MAVDNFDIIRRYAFDDESGIELNDMQEKMYTRWDAVIEMKTCRSLSTEQIVVKLMEQFVISRVTAYQDIGNAEALFGYSTPLNKRFRIGARINFLEEKIQTLWINKRYAAAAKLEACLAKYYCIYPDLKELNRPQNLVFSYNGDKPLTDNPMNIDDAEFVLLESVANEK